MLLISSHDGLSISLQSPLRLVIIEWATMQGICHQQSRWCSRPLLPSVIVINESSPASPSHNDICLPSLSIYIKLNNKVLTPGLEWDPFCSAPRFVYRYKSPITLRWKWQMDSLLQVQISGSISVEIKAQSVFSLGVVVSSLIIGLGILYLWGFGLVMPACY